MMHRQTCSQSSCRVYPASTSCFLAQRRRGCPDKPGNGTKKAVSSWHLLYCPCGTRAERASPRDLKLCNRMSYVVEPPSASTTTRPLPRHAVGFALIRPRAASSYRQLTADRYPAQCHARSASRLVADPAECGDTLCIASTICDREAARPVPAGAPDPGTSPRSPRPRPKTAIWCLSCEDTRYDDDQASSRIQRLL